MSSLPNELFLMQSPPISFGGQDIDEILLHLERSGGFNDVYIHTDNRIIAKVHGRVVDVLKRKIIDSEIDPMINHIAADGSARSYLTTGKDIDCSYEIFTPQKIRFRYRVNIVGGRTSRSGTGAMITMRSITSIPPDIVTLNVEPLLLANMVPRQGLVIVAGETGSGKSTLLASVLRKIKETPNGNKVVVTFEAPIEYVHDSYKGDPSNEIYQHEIADIGGHLGSFRLGVKNALRRNPNIIFIGESRDKETMEEMLRAANTGHLAYTTLHANSVADVITRVINEFPEASRQARLYELIANLRVVVVQYLAMATNGKRVPIKEYLVFTKEVRRKLCNVHPSQLESAVHEMLVANQESGLSKSMAYDAGLRFSSGLIDEEEYQSILSGI